MKFAAFAAAAAIALATTGARAQSLNFDFTFNDNQSHGTSISGEILGLTNNATSSPADFVITSATGPNASVVDLPFDLTPFFAVSNVTVANGAVTGIDLFGSGPNGLLFDFYTGFDYYFSFEVGPFIDTYENLNTSQPFWADGYITFTEVPEPASLAILAMGAVALAAASLARRRARGA